MDTSALASHFRSFMKRHAGLQAVAVGLVFLLGAMIAVRPAAAQFRDVGYTLEPGVQGIFEDDAAAFESSPLYGGALGLSFGRYFQASAEYFANAGVKTNFANVERLEGLVNRDVDVRRLGTRLRFNLYDRRVIPYLTVGSGVMQFDPNGAERTRTIYGTAGGGVTFSAYDRYRISLGAEMMGYRYDPVATFLGPTGAQNFETGTTLVTSPALTASLALYLGGRSLDEQTAVDQALQEQFGDGGFLSGVQLYVNPFHGRIEFNDALGFPKDQNLSGVNAGVSLGPYVGLRGFYWRGRKGTAVTDNLTGGFENLQMYGGELKLRLNLAPGRGFVPYAKVGGGYLDVLGAYAGDIPDATSPPEDRFFGTGGIGLEVPLTQSVKLSGGARGLVMDNPNTVEAGDPGDLYGSLMYTAGIEFRMGGGDDRPVPGPRPEPVLAQTDTSGAADTPEVKEEMSSEERLLARVDSLEGQLTALQASDSVQAQTRGPVRANVPRADTARRPAAPAPRRSNLSDRTMTVPVPESGEIYVRFGEDGRPQTTQQPPPATAEAEGDVPDDVEQRVRKALRRQLQQQGQADSAQALADADIERLIQRTVRNAVNQREQTTDRREQTAQAQRIQQLQNQVNQLQRQLQEQEDEQQQEAPRPTASSTPATASTPFYRQTLGRPLTYLVPIVGFRGGKVTNQAHIGLRADYRTSPTSRFRIVPEFGLGVGNGQLSPSLLFSGEYSFLRETTTELVGAPIEPYAGLGAGISSLGGFTFEPVLVGTFGLDYRFRGGRRVFLEYSTFDAFSSHRVHVGFRVRL
ncbi:porin family protein [Salinibacter ruber]|uniref:porin family protein n=1 Tax=Salinibacter ruber TaxID=146919 RepID=UPI00216A9102|nr:porin family protein [Salinibacter ruber]MCS3702493.1 polyhydroxyalkanoate synthesis regulator phasin [Salinibacter ruber]